MEIGGLEDGSVIKAQTNKTSSGQEPWPHDPSECWKENGLILIKEIQANIMMRRCIIGCGWTYLGLHVIWMAVSWGWGSPWGRGEPHSALFDSERLCLLCIGKSSQYCSTCYNSEQSPFSWHMKVSISKILFPMNFELRDSPMRSREHKSPGLVAGPINISSSTGAH